MRLRSCLSVFARVRDKETGPDQLSGIRCRIDYEHTAFDDIVVTETQELGTVTSLAHFQLACPSSVRYD